MRRKEELTNVRLNLSCVREQRFVIVLLLKHFQKSKSNNKRCVQKNITKACADTEKADN